MPKPAAAVDYRQCRVEQCEQGVCRAALECPRKVLRQEAPFEMPDIYPGQCRGCGLCIPACPSGAIRVM